MDKAYLFIKLCRAYNDDLITISRNYASTLCENMRVDKALDVLLGCTDELTARKIAAARQMQRYGFEYPKEWETDYLERS